MKLVPDWKRAWTWYSVHSSLIGLVLTSAAAGLAASGAATSWRAYLDDGIVYGIAAAIFLLTLVGRLISQKK